MAKMTIDIINPTIDLIKGLSETANSCISVFEFDIVSTPNANIKIFLERMNNNIEDYKYAQIDMGGGFQPYSSGTSMILNSTGTARFRVVIGNSYLVNIKSIFIDGNEALPDIQDVDGNICGMTKVIVADITNETSEEIVLSRCNADRPCDDSPPPTANDDEYTVEDGETKYLDILANDSANSPLATMSIKIMTQPIQGNISIINNQVRYEHTGVNNVTDTFTYRAVNNDNQESNTATVTIIIPYVDDGSNIPYYPITNHWAGSNGKSDRYTTNPTAAFTETYGVMLQRTEDDGTIRETDVPNGTKITNFLEGDIIHSTIPPSQIRALAIRYHNVDSFVVDLNTAMPELDKIRMRGNWTSLGHWDLSNLTKLEYFDISMCFIHTLQLPPTDENDTENKFTYAYLGHYEKSDHAYMVQRPRPAEYENEAAPRQVVNELMKRAYYSNVSDETPSAVETKNFNSQTSTGTLIVNGINYHKELIDRGWKIGHISTDETVDFASSAAGTAPLNFMTSHHDWHLVIPAEADWLSANMSEGVFSSEVQQITLSATANTTGAARSTEVYLRKIKRYPRTTGNSWEDGTEMHYRAKIIVTQP